MGDGVVSKENHQAAFKRRLQESGFTDKDATILGLKLLSAKQIEKMKLPAFAGFLIPYHDSKGKKTGFYRVRYLEDTRTALEQKTDKKPLRYVQSSDTLNEVYLAPSVDWPKILQDASTPLVITEGELKAACACKHALPTVGLGGVWNFRSASNLLPHLPWFDTVAWKARKVYIVYDSDAGNNPQVMKAEQELCRVLNGFGAEPYIVRLPALSPPKKTGLDDYIVSETVESLGVLFQDAEPYLRSNVLHRLNTEVAYVRDPGLILRIGNGQRMSVQSFEKHAYSTWTIPVPTFNGNGPTMEEKPAATMWLKWPERFEVDSITYLPGRSRFVEGSYNAWEGWGVEPARGDVTPWRRLVDHLMQHESPAARRWFEQWCAYPLQYPGEKLFSSVVVWGRRQGTGKTLLGHTLMRIYGQNATELDNDNLHASHNEWAENRQFVVGDEIIGGDKRLSADKMKGVITRREIRLNPKFIPSYVVPDCINYYFTSQHSDAFFLEDDDRRFFVVEADVPPLSDKFYREYDEWYKSDEGAAALFWHLLHVDTTGFNPKGRAFDTNSKREMIEDGRSDIDSWAANLVRAPEPFLAGREGDLWTPNELLTLYDPQGIKRVSPNGMGRALKRIGVFKPCKGTVFSTRWGSARLYAIRNVDKWRKADYHECLAHYENSRKLPNEKTVEPKKFKRKPVRGGKE